MTPIMQDRTLKALSLILSYPTRELQRAMPEIAAVLSSERRLTAATRRALRPLLDALQTRDIYELEEQYVMLFDRSRALSLNLFEHVHGESRDRGQAMVDLRQRYLDAGLDPVTNELPDYLPLFLDYCSVLPEPASRDMLAEPGAVMVALASRLADRQSDYAPILSVLCDIADVEMDEEAANALPPPEDPETLPELDAQWEEEEIRFTHAQADPAAACPQADAMLRDMFERDINIAKVRN